MTYNKKQQSYRKGKGRPRRRSLFESIVSLFPWLLMFFLVMGVHSAIHLDLESMIFDKNDVELKEHRTPIEEEFIESEMLEAVPPPRIDTGKIDGETFTVVQEMPRFPGCEDLDISVDEKKKCAEKKMLEFIYQNIKYPEVGADHFEEMTVISFIVNREGKIMDVKLLRGSETLAEEYMRIVKSMPQWIPGKQRGKPVNVQFNLPLRIKLES